MSPMEHEECRHTKPRDRIVCAWHRGLCWRLQWLAYERIHRDAQSHLAR